MTERSANPFPGMNPYLEGSWPDVHTRLIGYAADSLGDNLPADLVARTEEGVKTDSGAYDKGGHYLATAAAAWKPDGPPAWQPARGNSSGAAVTIPQMIELDPPLERWVEIREAGGRLVTVIEILSPSNKTGEGRGEWHRKSRNYLRTGTNVVEIDLLRTGGPMLPEDWLSRLQPSEGTRYFITAVRAARPTRREIYSCPLRERLPVISIPLRPGEADVALDLQPLIDRCYRSGRYWLADHSRVPGPPLPADDARWAAERIS